MVLSGPAQRSRRSSRRYLCTAGVQTVKLKVAERAIRGSGQTRQQVGTVEGECIDVGATAFGVGWNDVDAGDVDSEVRRSAGERRRK